MPSSGSLALLHAIFAGDCVGVSSLLGTVPAALGTGSYTRACASDETSVFLSDLPSKCVRVARIFGQSVLTLAGK